MTEQTIAYVGDQRDDPRRTINVRTLLERFGLVFVFVAIIFAFSVALPGQFFTSTNLRITLGGQAVVLFLALGITAPLRAGDFDLSVGAVMIGSASIVGVLTTRHGVAVLPAVALALVGGLCVGLLNAVLVVGLKIDAFIVTLGTLTLLGGVTVWYTQGNVISSLPTSLTSFSNDKFLGLPYRVYYGWILVALLWYLYEYTPFGRRLLFTGGNRDSARLTGIRVSRVRIAAFLISALVAAVAGILLAGSIGAVDPTSAGAYLLQPYAAAFLGTTVFQFGRFNVMGTMVGLYLLAAGVSGLQLLGAESWVSDVFNGTTLIMAVAVATLMRGSMLEGRRRRTRRASSAGAPDSS